ncbi:MAG: class I SAM-dependent methyltransferase [Pseudomonadota bacterium]|nr:MAG: class I SAM-dependent methyltransferase [Pseudomonadota bacterium]
MNTTGPGTAAFPVDAHQLGRFRDELEQAGLFRHIERCRCEFSAAVDGTTARGHRYGFGAFTEDTATELYAVIRTLCPRRVVETGVCNGVSTLMILAALERNGTQGRLWSVDLPEQAGQDYPEDFFWAGKRGAAVPQGRPPGWIVPETLRPRWRLVLGRSQDVLPDLLAHIGAIDLFLHDSEHSPECMAFEYRHAWQHLADGGVLMSDDTHWNTTFRDFADRRQKPVVRLSRGLALVVK